MWGAPGAWSLDSPASSLNFLEVLWHAPFSRARCCMYVGIMCDVSQFPTKRLYDVSHALCSVE